jgi:UDPglucose 6-dehydrogenase
MRISVIGTGYLGATHAACMAELGHDVLGVDLDPAKVDKLRSGQVPFFEPGLQEILQRNLDSGRLNFTTDYVAAAQFAETHFLAVGTPQKKGDYGADLTHVFDAVEALASAISVDSVIFGKSTVPVGTADELQKRANIIAPSGVRIEIAWNPEFLREGFAVEDTLRPDRLVIGVQPGAQRAANEAREIYAESISAGVPLIVTDTATAELVKVSANAFLATKISFINAMAEVCEASGADVLTLADAIGYDARIGRRFLNAGLGFGGGCLPKDIRAFMARAGEIGAPQALTFLREVDHINMRRRSRMVEQTRIACGGTLLGARVAVLGAAFKPNSDDVRDSPALNVAGQIQLQGASVSVFDPKAMENSRRQYPTLNYSHSVADACKGADVVLVLTEWPEFVSMDPMEIAQHVRQKIVIDGRLCLDPELWENADWAYHT